MYSFANFDANSDVDWDSVFDTHQVGGSVDRGQHFYAYPGSVYQRGGSPFTQLLGRLFLSALPILKRAGSAIGKEALAASASIAGDVALGQDFGESIKRNSSLGYRNLVDRATNKLMQKGGRPRKARKTKKPRKTRKSSKPGKKSKKIAIRKNIRKKPTQKRRKNIKKKSRDIFGHYNGN